MNKWQAWYESLPEHTQRYLDTKPVWHDSDLVKAALMAFVLGVIVGIIV